MAIIQSSQETGEHVRPIQWLEIGQQQPVPAPLIRINTCGLLTIEVLEEIVSTDPPLARYLLLSPEQLRGRGAAPALLLLKLLLSGPQLLASNAERFATKSWLIEQFCRDRELFSNVRLDNIVSQLRGLLCPPAYEELRTHVVAHVRSSPGSGDGYQLAAYPLIWTDLDALHWHMEQATRMERFGDNPLPYWERVYTLIRRGTYLPDEAYSDWSQTRREEVEGAMRQSVQALARIYLARHGEAGEEEALLLLRSYWQEHPEEEDVLRPLMDLLGRRERYQEATKYYEQLCTVLEADERQPDTRTQDMAAYIRTKQLQRRQGEPLSSQHPQLSSPDAQHPPLIVPGTIEITLEEENQESDAQLRSPAPSFQPLLTETRHLIGREAWLASIHQMVQTFPAKKLIILQGPVGVGKSSELARLANAFQQSERTPLRVIWFALPAAEWDGNPDTALDVLLGTLLSACGIAHVPSETPHAKQLDALFSFLEQQPHPAVILLDNAECMFGEEGALAPCWEAFLTRFVRHHHQATLFLATKEWSGWSGREGVFVAETIVPPLTRQESVTLLSRLGLETVPDEHLSALSERMAGIPLLLEWAAKLIHDPLLLDDWQGFDEQTETPQHPGQDDLTRRILRLLEDPALLGTHLATRLTPLLQRIIDKHLSSEARHVLNRLAVSTIPLGKAALQLLCPRPALLKELRDASLLAAYSNRVQLLPIVASTVCQQLPPEQRQEAEEQAIQAYTRWLDEGNLEMREAGSVVTELAVLLLTHQRLLDAAELLLYRGWLSFNVGCGTRLALLTQHVLDHAEKLTAASEECAGFVLCQTVFPFLGELMEYQKQIDYLTISSAFLKKEVVLPTEVERCIVHRLLVHEINDLRFEDAQTILDAYGSRLEARHIAQPKQHPTFLQEQAFFLEAWCDYLEERNEREKVQTIREQIIALHQHYIQWLSTREKKSSLKENQRKMGLAYHFTSLGYHLNRIGQYEEALHIIEKAILLHEQGFGYIGVLAASYGEKSQIFMELGRFQEALLFDEKALAETQRCAHAGYEPAQEELWIYHVNRGRLYLRLGRVDEAEQLLREALPHIPGRRRIYRMFAKEALEEIALWRHQVQAPQHQLDWRWIKRFRELVSYDSYWWLTWAGPFTPEEQRQWGDLFALPLDETTKEQLGMLMKLSRERELEVALAEQREPRLHYPAIAIEEIRRCILAQLALEADIRQHEPNSIVRSFYQGAIEEELDYLHLIEATYEGDTARFWECSRRLFPLPTEEEMTYAFAPVKRALKQGLKTPQTADVAQQFQEFLRTHLHLPLDLLSDEAELPGEQQKAPDIAPQPHQHISAQAARRFFNTVLQKSGYEGWQVVIDPNATNARVEQGARSFFLPEKRFSLTEIRHLFIHELAGHVAPCVAGEHSLLGLLGLHTKNSAPTNEGVALYHERQILTSHGQVFNDLGLRSGTLLAGLASGVITPPQTFLSLCTFLTLFTLLTYLSKNPEVERQKAQKLSQSYALSLCLRAYRGVPDLEQAGVCYLQDTIHLHGLRLVEQAVAEDETVLDRLAVGVCALEQLPDLQELGILSAPQPLRKLAYAVDLNDYILSFEEQSIDVKPKKNERG